MKALIAGPGNLARAGEAAVMPFTYTEVVNCYSGRKAARYARAQESLEIRPLEDTENRASAFVKVEKMALEKLKHRLVVHRSPRFNLEIARFLKPIEHFLYSITSLPKIQHVSPSRLIAKGLSAEGRAELLLRKWKQFSTPLVYSLDASRFDGSIRRYQLKACHDAYLALLPDDRFRHLLGLCMDTKVVTSHGHRFKISGKRLTGDQDTALGNCLISCAMAIAAGRTMGLKKFDIMVDGDDVLFFMEASESSRFSTEAWTGFGHTMTVEVARRLEDIEFCQSKLVELAGGWALVRNYRKVLGSLGASHRYYNTEVGGKRYLKSLLIGEAALNRGVPVLGPVAQALLDQLEGVAALDLPHDVRVDMARNARSSEITANARRSFADAFGISPDWQMALEEDIVNVDLNALLSTPWEYREETRLS